MKETSLFIETVALLRALFKKGVLVPEDVEVALGEIRDILSTALSYMEEKGLKENVIIPVDVLAFGNGREAMRFIDRIMERRKKGNGNPDSR